MHIYTRPHMCMQQTQTSDTNSISHDDFQEKILLIGPPAILGDFQGLSAGGYHLSEQ